MATISISELRPVGADLFVDSESYLTDINDDNLNDINGGITPAIVAFATASSPECVTFAASLIGGAIAGYNAAK